MTTQTTLTFLSAIAVQAEIEDLLPRVMAQEKIAVQVAYDVNPAVAKRLIEGEVFDVGLTNPWYVGEMISRGRIFPETHTPFGRVPLAIGMAGDAPGPIVNSLDGIRALLMTARSIGYTSIGTSGKTFLRAIEMMRLSDDMSGRLRPMGAGEPPIAAARRDIQYAVAPLSRILAAPGIVPVATFPSELGLDIDLSMFVSSQTPHRDRAEKLIGFFSDQALDAYLTAHGISRYSLAEHYDPAEYHSR